MKNKNGLNPQEISAQENVESIQTSGTDKPEIHGRKIDAIEYYITSSRGRIIARFLIIVYLGVYIFLLFSDDTNSLSTATKQTADNFFYNLQYLANLFSIAVLTLLISTGVQKTSEYYLKKDCTNEEFVIHSAITGFIRLSGILAYMQIMASIRPIDSAPRLAAFIVTIIVGILCC